MSWLLEIAVSKMLMKVSISSSLYDHFSLSVSFLVPCAHALQAISNSAFREDIVTYATVWVHTVFVFLIWSCRILTIAKYNTLLHSKNGSKIITTGADDIIPEYMRKIYLPIT